MPSLVHVNDDRGMVFIIEPIMLLGIEEIDREHAMLFSIINRVNEDLKLRAYTEDEIQKLFEEIACYALHHFETEANLFEKTRYPQAADHMAKHDQILAKIMMMRCKRTKMIEILKLAVNWMNHHILVEDKKFADYKKNLDLSNPGAWNGELG